MSSRGRIVVAGAGGFLGTPLVAALAADGYDVVALSRGGAKPHGAAESIAWNPDGTSGPWAAVLDGAEAVVNLAGENIGGGRWTAARKERILNSRVLATTSLAAAILRAHVPPRTLVSASGVGYYGARGDELLDEDGPAGDDFLARLGVAWETEARRAATAGTRVVVARTGMVIDAGGGALAAMLLPFRLGVGGRLGSGRQWISWIHRADWVRLIQWAIATPAVDGALNASAPSPVTNAEFTRALARALHRPAVVPAPAFALRLALGEMADALLLNGQRVVPAKALELGFRFEYDTIEKAFAAIFGR